MLKPDVLIIGGGIVGVCSAYYLASGSGATVTLIEEHQVGSPMASSYGNMGLLVESYSRPVAEPQVIAQGLRWLFQPEAPLYIKPRLDPDFIRWLIYFLRACSKSRCNRAEPVLYEWLKASANLYMELVANFGVDVNYERKGGLFLFRDNSSWLKAEARARNEKKAGLASAVTAVTKERLHTMLPALKTEIAGALHYHDDGRLNPNSFVNSIAAAAKQCGASIYNNTKAVGFESIGQTIKGVHTNRGTFQPSTVVLAAGFLSSSLVRELGVRVPIQAAKGYSLTVRRPETCPDIPVHFHDSRVVLTPFGSELMRIGGTLELAGNDRGINSHRVKAIRRTPPRYLAGMDKLEIVEIWQGMRPLSADSLPIIGRPRKLDNLILATGHGMIGMSLGPITGKVVAEITAGRKTSVSLDLFRADRF